LLNQQQLVVGAAKAL